MKLKKILIISVILLTSCIGRNISSGINSLKNSSLETASQFALILMPTLDRMGLLDLRTNRTSIEVKTGRNPTDLVVDPDKKNILVINRLDGSVSSFFREDNMRIQATGTVGNGQNPNDVIFSNSGKEAFVSFIGTQRVTIFKVLNRDRPQLIESLFLRDDKGNEYLPNRLAISDNDNTLFVSDRNNKKIFIYKRENNSFKIDKIVDTRFQDKLITPEYLYFFKDKLYISDSLNSAIAVYDILDNSFINLISLKDDKINKDSLPLKIVINKRSNKLYVINQSTSNVSVVDIKENKLIKNISLALGNKNDSFEPSDIAISNDESFIYVTNNIGRNLSIIDTKKDILLRNIGTTQSPGNLPPISAIELL